MDSCLLAYIPERLHSNGRPDIPVFEIGELLYWRCDPEKINEPFDGIRLYDLSTNREGDPNDPLSRKEDVLFNLDPTNHKGQMLEMSILTMVVPARSSGFTFEKTLTEAGVDGKNNPIVNSCEIKLLHDKLPCNYSHSIMRLTLNGEIVTRENYNNTLKKRGESISRLRTKCKLEFEKLILDLTT